MQTFPPTVVLRHRRENLKKCSLRGLEQRPDFQFYTYPQAQLPDLKGYVMLSFEGELLSEKDADRGLFILDSTWRYAPKMSQFVGPMEVRSLPNHYRTAYPRRQDDCADPERGLASIEAVYIAYVLMGRDPVGLLDNYHWQENFLKLNSLLIP